jgi:hypothetical protein
MKKETALNASLGDRAGQKPSLSGVYLLLRSPPSLGQRIPEFGAFITAQRF